MAEEFQGSLSSFNSWSSLRCSDFFSSPTAVNSGETGETFGCFPANTDNSPHELSSLDLLSSSIDWSQSFLECSETYFEHASPLEERPTTKQGQIQNDLTETTSQDLSLGFFPSDENLTELIIPTFGFPLNSSMFWSTNHSSNFSAKSNTTASRDSILPTAKKLRIDTPSLLPTFKPSFKVRKEKLGDRITALQQLVSPFGKTDTASVLHEAIEYIKFLHDQVNILERKTKNGECSKKDLRSQGLCLVPISSTFAVASYQISPVDFWTQLWRNL